MPVHANRGSIMADSDNLIQLTADIVSSMVGNNNVASGDVPGLIKSVHGALSGLGVPEPEPQVEKPKGAVSARASIKSDGLISMIDGKKYQTLRRHITRHGYTPETYRETFGLPRDYPLTSSNYSELRRGMAKLIGLGRKAVGLADDASTVATEPAADAPAEPAKRGRKPRAAKPADAPVDSPAAEANRDGATDTTPAPDTAPAANVETAQDAPVADAALAAGETRKPKRGRPRKAAPEAAGPDAGLSAATPEVAPADAVGGEDAAPAPRKRRSKKNA
jgi:predicted transcriptional regulator